MTMRALPEETPVAFVFNGSTHAVMLATPADFEDFAYGFALTEGVIENAEDIREVETRKLDLGVDLRIWLGHERAAAYNTRRRTMAGPTGCGLCGVESLQAAMRPIPPLPAPEEMVGIDEIVRAFAALGQSQPLYGETRAVHAAAFWRFGHGLVAVREDVGRHNALDKLAGALTRGGQSTRDGAILLTSRISVELVQKAARLGAPVLAALSTPTTLAARAAQDCGLTLIGNARGADFRILSHGQRIAGGKADGA